MKVDPHLTLIKGSETSEITPKGQARSNHSQEGVVALISQENRRAWKHYPASLKEAKQVLERISACVRQTREATLADVHHLTSPYLIVLR
ncbi:MAG: hypothetical protein QME75_13170 [Deltaproteobacteria bacterium]|nr:hypothetical protein [Deltaproteobacteria bacterium]